MMLVKDAVADALRKIKVAALDDPPTADMEVHGARELDRMLKSWDSFGFNLWKYASQTVTLTTAAHYTLSPVRPMRILNVNRVLTGIECSMVEMTRNEYDEMPQKASQGTPTQWYYDRQAVDALLYVWPVLATADGSTLKITYERSSNSQLASSENLDVPPEWESAVIFNLAMSLAPDYSEADTSKVDGLAAAHLSLALSSDREGSVYFR